MARKDRGMITVDLSPGEYEVIEVSDSRIPTDMERLAYAMGQVRDSFEQLHRAFFNLSFGLRGLRTNFPEPLPEAREPHHMHLIERHIRKPRRSRK